MNKRFNQFTELILKIHKHFQKLKELEMEKIGLKASDVSIFLELYHQPSGLTAAELSRICQLDKAAVSRALLELEKKEMVVVESDPSKKKYAAKIKLSKFGQEHGATICQRIDENVAFVSLQISQSERKNFYKNLAEIADQLEKLYQKKRNEKR